MKKYIPNLVTAAVFAGVTIYFENKILGFAKVIIPVAAAIVGWLVWKNNSKEVNKLK
jgi:hypothetical protein